MKLPQYVYLLFFFLSHYLHPILFFLISIKIFNQNDMTNIMFINYIFQLLIYLIVFIATALIITNILFTFKTGS